MAKRTKKSDGRWWWTVTGSRTTKTATLMKHETETDAEWHYGLSRSLGGGYDWIARTRRAATGVEALAWLEGAGWKVEQVVGMAA